MTPEAESKGIRETFEDETLLALKMEEGAMSQRLQTASKTGKCKEVHSLLEPPGGR